MRVKRPPTEEAQCRRAGLAAAPSPGASRPASADAPTPHRSAGHLSRGRQIGAGAGAAAEDDPGSTAALPKKGC